MLRFIVIGILLLTGWLSYERFHSPKPAPVPAAIAPEERVITPPSWYGHPPGTSQANPSNPSSPATAKPVNFVCDGRTHCSQMTSCEEATFFLRNCPNIKMDSHGKGNGIPCERQWC